MGWQKALPEDDVRELVAALPARLPRRRCTHYVDGDGGRATSRCTSTTPSGPVHDVLRHGPRCCSRVELLDGDDRARRTTSAGSREDAGVRAARRRPSARKVRDGVRGATWRRSRESKRCDRELFYDVKDVVGKSGFGIGSAGLPAYNVLVEGYSQALDNDVVLSMKQANVAGRQPVRRHARGATSTSSTRATAPWSASARCRCTPTRCSATPPSTASGTSSPRSRRTRSTWTGARSPSPTRSAASSQDLGRATAKVHCASDEDSDAGPGRLPDRGGDRRGRRGRRKERSSTTSPTSAIDYAAARARTDHALFVDAFRGGRFDLVSAT